ncbi:MAG TPA: L-2-hydroxyglutarate oxidase [Candidatus Tectomicrobia bacterium]|nr:L-2-hydroxyglutarate oxidase [Candidatus Tectomicrobia bacterium]
MHAQRYDVVIIGGGIIGLATAMALKAGSSTSLIVLEAEDHLAQHQTGHNSGVIHSGLYYRPGSLKARNCVVGRKAMYRFCQDHGIAHEQCGKVVVATDLRELPALDELERRGRANGLEGLRRLGAEEIREHEPHTSGIAGLLVPETGIANYKQVAQVYADIIRKEGGEIHTKAHVHGCRRYADELVLETSRGAVHCRSLVNCGGLHADEVARVCGVDPKLQIIPFRGEYYEIVPERQFLVKNLIYPVPDPRFPFLGVHFTRMIHGGVEAGPNAVLAFKRQGYSWEDFSATDTLRMFSYPGFWKMVARYWQTGLGEMYRSLSQEAFVKALQKLVPELRLQDVRRAGAGVRAQAVAPDGALLDDFCIVETERMVHVLNAPSPGATASISIGKSIAEMAAKNFDLA